LQTFVLRLRERGVRPVSVNTYLKALNAFARWLHAEGHQTERLVLPSPRAPRRLTATVDQPSLRALLTFRPKGFRRWRTFTVVMTISTLGVGSRNCSMRRSRHWMSRTSS
jgi:site-specific recombinase XerC